MTTSLGERCVTKRPQAAVQPYALDCHRCNSLVSAFFQYLEKRRKSPSAWTPANGGAGITSTLTPRALRLVMRPQIQGSGVDSVTTVTPSATRISTVSPFMIRTAFIDEHQSLDAPATLLNLLWIKDKDRILLVGLAQAVRVHPEDSFHHEVSNRRAERSS